MKEKVRPLYLELMGYLSQAPSLEHSYYLSDATLWNQYHTTIDELNGLTKKDYKRFKISNILGRNNRQEIANSEYRNKLSGLIMRLYGEYFSDEVQPFSGQPSTIVTQTNNQSVQVAILLDFQSFIDKKLYSADLEEKEKNFLQKVKNALPNIKSSVELVGLVISIAKDLGLNIEQIFKLFKGGL